MFGCGRDQMDDVKMLARIGGADKGGVCESDEECVPHGDFADVVLGKGAEWRDLGDGGQFDIAICRELVRRAIGDGVGHGKSDDMCSVGCCDEEDGVSVAGGVCDGALDDTVCFVAGFMPDNIGRVAADDDARHCGVLECVRCVEGV